MIKIVADTTSSIPPEEAEKLGIGYIPQIIVFGDESFRDDNEMNTAQFMARLRASSALPKTAAPPPPLYHPIYKEFGTPGNTIIVICPSAQLSGTVRSATVAAEEFPQADIRIIDTLSIGTGLGSIVKEAVQWANDGLDADTIVSKIQDMIARNRTYFLVDTLEYLYKGGRIGGAKMLFGSILQIKPILMISEGHTEPVESQRTKKRAMARLKELIALECPANESAMLSVMHIEAENEAKELAEHFKSSLGLKEVPIYLLPPAIIVHAGPGALAISFSKKDA